MKLPPSLLSHLLSFIQAGSPHQISQFAMLSLKQLPVAVAFTGEQIELLPACPYETSTRNVHVNVNLTGAKAS